MQKWQRSDGEQLSYYYCKKKKKSGAILKYLDNTSRSGRYATKQMQECSTLSSIICQHWPPLCMLESPVDLDGVRTQVPWGRQNPWCHVVDPLKAQGWTLFLHLVTNKWCLNIVRVVAFHYPFKRIVLFKSKFLANHQGFLQKKREILQTWW